MIVYANRASAILFNLLRSRHDRRPFLLPANICPIVPAVFLKAGYSFDFVDISARDYCMDRDAVFDLVRSHRYGGVVMVRTYGFYEDLASFFQQLRAVDEDMLLVDDRCACQPSFEVPGEGADVTLFSTGHGKYADLGFGGYAVLEHHVPYRHFSLRYSPVALQSLEASYKRAVEQRERFNYADGDWLDGRDPATSLAGYMDTTIAESKRAAARKSLINEYYRSVLPPEIVLGEPWNHWRFCIRVENKGRLLQDIFSRGLFASSHYAGLAGIFAPGKAPVADRLHERVINVFNDRHISMDQVELLASVVNSHVLGS